MKYIAIIVSALLLVAGSVTPASAETDNWFFVTALFGYSQMSETTAKIETPERQADAIVDPDGSVAIGVGIYLRALPKLAVGVEAAWLDHGTTGSNVGPEHKLASLPVTLQAIYFIPTKHGFTPYGTVGLGNYHNRYDGTFEGLTATVTNNSFGWNFGGGMNFEVERGWGIGFDIRYHMVSDPVLEETVALGTIKADVDSWNMLTVAARLVAF